MTSLSVRTEREGGMLPTLAVGWRASALKGKEEEPREVASVSGVDASDSR